MDKPTRGFRATKALDILTQDDLSRQTHINGRIMIHKNEKIPWKSEGARHAHVDCHWPVPSVIPAAIKAPTLVTRIPLAPCLCSVMRHLLVKVIQETNTPRTPSARKSLCQVDAPRDAGHLSSKTQKDSSDNEHGDVLSGSLE